MTSEPVNLTTALASFEDLWSPRIVATMNDYDVRIAKTEGEHVWHSHDDTDEFFMVIDGQFNIGLRDADGNESVVKLNKGDMYVVPKGVQHRPSSSTGASILMFEPTGTPTTGSYDGDVPDHIDSTVGHEL